jgi:Vitamin B6 photo-protection and homoeostasis
MEALEIHETDEVGRATATYVISPAGNASSRVDIVPAVKKLLLTQRLLSVFLPNGYPHTVSPDYTPYQVYDSLQAFFSAIAGLLASRAVVSLPFYMYLYRKLVMFQKRASLVP